MASREYPSAPPAFPPLARDREDMPAAGFAQSGDPFRSALPPQDEPGRESAPVPLPFSDWAAI